MSIFNSKKVWEFLIKIQLTKSGPKRTRGWQVTSLMPIRVKGKIFETNSETYNDDNSRSPEN